MKNALSIALIAASTMLSVSVYAVPPIPPTAAKKVRVKVEIVCKEMNALTEKEIADLNEDTDRIVSFDDDSEVICFKKSN